MYWSAIVPPIIANCRVSLFALMRTQNNDRKRSGVEIVFWASMLFFLCMVSISFYMSKTISKAAGEEVKSPMVELDATQVKSSSSVLGDKATPEKEIFTPQKTIAIDTIENHIPTLGKFVAADLDSMKLILFEDGGIKETFPILSKGKPGSFWETPSGDYKILSKIRTHFSSVGKVYMPYSMQFYGNFFIHGWPYYPDGTPVAPGYSGGCIRLDVEDARKVFEFVENGTPIFVHESSEDDSNPKREDIRIKDIPLPHLTSDAFIIADINTGEVFLEKNMKNVYPIASITKLMTAIVANEAIMFDRVITINDYILETHGDSGHLQKGEEITANDLLYPLLMESSNDAAKAYSYYYGETGFISLMNKKAEALGMTDTTFTDSSGISSGNTSTGYDLYLMAKYLNNKKSFILAITRLPEKELLTPQHEHRFTNFNIFSDDSDFVGGKTGYTQAANETMLSVFKLQVGNDKYNVAFIVLGSKDREKDVQSLLQWFKEAAVNSASKSSLSL